MKLLIGILFILYSIISVVVVLSMAVLPFVVWKTSFPIWTLFIAYPLGITQIRYHTEIVYKLIEWERSLRK